MKTITYTYDETRCTNKDCLILELTESIDDGIVFAEISDEYKNGELPTVIHLYE